MSFPLYSVQYSGHYHAQQREVGVVSGEALLHPAGTSAFLVKGVPGSMALGGAKELSNGSGGGGAVHAHARSDNGAVPLAAAVHRGSDASLRDVYGGPTGTGECCLSHTLWRSCDLCCSSRHTGKYSREVHGASNVEGKRPFGGPESS